MSKLIRKMLKIKPQTNPIVWESTEIDVENNIEIRREFNMYAKLSNLIDIYDIYLEVVNVHIAENYYNESITDIYIGTLDSKHLKAFYQMNEDHNLYDYFLGDLETLIKNNVSPLNYFKKGLKANILNDNFTYYQISE